MKCLIIGCGYTGKRIAAEFIKNGHTVTGTTTREENLDAIKAYCSDAYVCSSANTQRLNELLDQHQAIIVTAAPKSSSGYADAYLELARSIADFSGPKDKILIYTSSTSVYAENCGNPVDERSSLDPQSTLARLLIQTEETYEKLCKGWRVCIFRLSEIYGSGRDLKHKIAKYAGSSPIPGSGNRYANLVHVDDIAAAGLFAINHPLQGIFNLTCDEHPKRKELYDAICLKYGLPLCTWDESLRTSHGGNKQVLNHKIKSMGYRFKHPRIIY